MHHREPSPLELLNSLRVTAADLAGAATYEERMKLAYRRGIYCEARVLYALNLRALPPWLASFRAASPTEDRDGVDVVFELADGRTLGLQVKGGRYNARKWNARFPRGAPRPPVIIVRDHLSNASIGQIALRMIAQAAGLWREPEARGGTHWFRWLAASWFGRTEQGRPGSTRGRDVATTALGPPLPA